MQTRSLSASFLVGFSPGLSCTWYWMYGPTVEHLFILHTLGFSARQRDGRPLCLKLWPSPCREPRMHHFKTRAGSIVIPRTANRKEATGAVPSRRPTVASSPREVPVDAKLQKRVCSTAALFVIKASRGNGGIRRAWLEE